MSFNYANAKKMRRKERKRTKIEQATQQVAVLQQVVNRCVNAIILMNQVLEKYGRATSWLEKEDIISGPENTQETLITYVWSRENNPVKEIEEVRAKVRRVLGPWPPIL